MAKVSHTIADEVFNHIVRDILSGSLRPKDQISERELVARFSASRTPVREALKRLGRPFEQIDTPLANGMKGSGLGLAIARSIVELHGGSLAIRSALGVGTVVRVRLPISAPAPSALAFRRDAARAVAA